MSIENIIKDTIKKGDFEELFLEYFSEEDKKRKIRIRHKGFKNYSEEILKIYEKLVEEEDQTSETINIGIVVAVTEEAWYFSVPLSFIFRGLE